MSTAFKRGRSPNSPVTTLLQNPGLSSATTSTNANSSGSVRPMNTNSPSSASSQRSMIIREPQKRRRLAKALVGRKRDKLDNTAGETSGNSSNSAMNNRPTPTPKRKKIASATRSTVRQIPQPAFRTAAMGAANKERNIEKNYANLVNQRNALPSGYKVKFLNKLLLNAAKNGDKAVKLTRTRMREAVAEGLARSKNLRSLTKKLSPNGQRKFANTIKNNLSVSRHMMIKNAISREITNEAKAAKEKAEANKVLNSAIQQRRVNAKAAKEKVKSAKSAKSATSAKSAKSASVAANAKAVATVKAKTRVKNMPNENLINVLGNNASIIENTGKKMAGDEQDLGNVLLKTINSIKNPGNRSRIKGAKQHLRFLYGAGLPDSRLKALKTLKIRDVQMNILRQFTALWPKIVAVPDKPLKINLDEDGTLDFLFLMWCDMLHDATVDRSVSFGNFLNGDAVRMLFPGTSGIKFAPTIFIKSLVGESNGVFAFTRDANNQVFDLRKAKTTPYEAIWKDVMMQGHIPIGKNKKSTPTNIKMIPKDNFKLDSIRKNINKKVYISIDQESVGVKEFSKIIDKSKNGERYTLGSVVGYANIFDAGSQMVTQGHQQDKVQSRAWGMMNDPKNVKFMMAYYSSLFQVEINGRGKNISNNQNTNRSAKFGFGEYANGEIKFILNKNEIKPSRGAKKKAKNTGDPSQQLIKFMGDFMQVLTALHAQTFGGGEMLYVPASGDGMFVVIYIFMARKLGLVPKIITSTKDQSRLHFINLSDVIVGASNQNSEQLGGGSYGFLR